MFKLVPDIFVEVTDLFSFFHPLIHLLKFNFIEWNFVQNRGQRFQAGQWIQIVVGRLNFRFYFLI